MMEMVNPRLLSRSTILLRQLERIGRAGSSAERPRRSVQRSLASGFLVKCFVPTMYLRRTGTRLTRRMFRFRIGSKPSP